MKILFIAPVFYDYHHFIISEIERRGHQVRFHADRPARWLYSPARHLPGPLSRAVFDAHLRGALRRARTETFDLVILINGKIITPDFVATMRKAQPTARFIMYQWDGLKEVDYRPLLPLFDIAATFDPVDAEALGIGYMPTFYLPAYRLREQSAAPKWDLAFVASYNPSRYASLREVLDHCERNGIRLKSHLYLAPLDFLKLRLLSPRPPAFRDVAFRKISHAQVISLYRKSCAVLDIEDLKQSGLTMRCYEALATGKFLVTTNPRAVQLLPELAGRIVTISRDRPEFSAEQLRNPPGWGEELDKYSLERWVDRLLSL